MSAVSIFINYTQWVEDKSLIIIINQIKKGVYKQQIEEIRKLIAAGNKQEADKQKAQLPAFTPSGTFSNGRKAHTLSQYSGYVILDIDKISDIQLAEVKEKAALIPNTFAAFTSPSGNGVKIIVSVSSIPENHKLAFMQVAQYYEAALNVKIDQSGKDVCRLCYMSYDADCYENIHAIPMQITDVAEVNNHLSETDKIEIGTSNSDWEAIFEDCIKFTDKKATYIDGNRNNYIHLLACNCNRVGIPENIATESILHKFNLEKKETTATIKGAYRNNQNEFATIAIIAKPCDTHPISKEEQLLNMPYLPDAIFDKLPLILKSGSEVFNDKRERDVFLTGALAIISGCMRNVVGLYRAKEHYANLYIFIIAPAASGKGSLTYARILGDKYHDKLVQESIEKQKQFKIEENNYKKKLSNPRTDTTELNPPVEPDFKVLFIPANNSSARVIQHLKEGDEQGIFCETEADTMGMVLKQDWGSYSDLLRKAFHHEPISYSRKTNKEWVEIKRPCLSVALAGTPNQVENLIKSAEDGLFSRFIFYTFKTDTIWVPANDTLNGVNLTQKFNDLSENVLCFVEFLCTNEKIEFHLTEQQWDQLNKFGEDSIMHLATFVSEDLSSTAKRLGLILFRLCMIITALRYFDNAESQSKYTCTDEDFDIALQMVKVYQEHAVFMFNELPKKSSVADRVIGQFFDALPETFKRKDAIDLAEKQFDIKERTADLYLAKLTKAKYLEKAKNGVYQKVQKQ
jgi:hypothetical protein